MSPVLRTPSLYSARLELRPAAATALRAELAGHAALAQALSTTVPADWPPELYDADAIRYTLAALGDREDGGPFGLYYVLLQPGIDRAVPGGAVAGIGGFKGPPDPATGEVELGYGILGSFQRRGFATEAVAAWVSRAFAEPSVRTVIGQTLDTLVPSIGVLEKAGFHFAGAGNDPDVPAGATVVRYEQTRLTFEARAAAQPIARGDQERPPD
jgi:[ribosomal protein S5]-alanine N-acetyltransferase